MLHHSVERYYIRIYGDVWRGLEAYTQWWQAYQKVAVPLPPTVVVDAGVRRITLARLILGFGMHPQLERWRLQFPPTAACACWPWSRSSRSKAAGSPTPSAQLWTREFIKPMWPAHSAKNASLELDAQGYQSAPRMIGVVTKLTLGPLRLVTKPQGATSDPEAWKKIIGDKSVSTRLQTLPQPRPRWGALLTSTIFQVLLAGLLIVLPAVFPDKLAGNKSYEVVPIVAPETEIALPPKQPLVHPNIIETPPPPRGTAPAAKRRKADRTKGAGSTQT